MSDDDVFKRTLQQVLFLQHGMSIDVQRTRPNAADLARALRLLHSSFHDTVPLARRSEFIQFVPVGAGDPRASSFPLATPGEVSDANAALQTPFGVAHLLLQCNTDDAGLTLLRVICKLLRTMGVRFVVAPPSTKMLARQAYFKEAAVSMRTISHTDAEGSLFLSPQATITPVLLADTLKCEG